MSMSCIVQDCRSYGNSRFYQLPKNEKVRRIWIEKLKLSEWFVTTKTIHRVCFRHFPKDAFKTSNGRHVTLKKGNYLFPF